MLEDSRSCEVPVVGERFFEWSLDLLAIAGYDGHFKRLNPSWERTLGWSPQELMARPFLDFVHPEDRAATLAEANRIADEGADCLSFANRYRCKDGSHRWLHWVSRPLPEEKLIYAIARDITAQKEAERALKESEERLRLALRVAHMGIWDWDSTRGTVRASQGVDRLMGLPRGALEWSPDQFFGALHPEDREPGLRLIRHSQGEFDWTFRVSAPEGGITRLRTQGRVVGDLLGQPVKALGTLTPTGG